ncbi:MAG: hypothetical protein AB7O98_11220 [Hyphomonadaceae bacterium]
MSGCKLDRLLEAWAARPQDRPLDQLEPSAWARIASLARPKSTGALGMRAAFAAMMLAIGIAAGGAASASASHDLSPFSMRPAYAPSTLLEGAR